jgi:hypothetical protein
LRYIEAHRCATSKLEKEAIVKTQRKTKLLGVAIVVGGFLMGTTHALFGEAGPRYPHALWFFNRIGGVIVYGASLGFLGILGWQREYRGRRDFVWAGEWLGIASSFLLLSTAWLKLPLLSTAWFKFPATNDARWPQLIMWILSAWIVQCVLSVMAVAFLFAKFFTRFRPGVRADRPRTDTFGCLICALTGLIVTFQFACELVDG